MHVYGVKVGFMKRQQTNAKMPQPVGRCGTQGKDPVHQKLSSPDDTKPKGTGSLKWTYNFDQEKRIPATWWCAAIVSIPTYKNQTV
jgi:hypothetical protein